MASGLIVFIYALGVVDRSLGFKTQKFYTIFQVIFYCESWAAIPTLLYSLHNYANIDRVLNYKSGRLMTGVHSWLVMVLCGIILITSFITAYLDYLLLEHSGTEDEARELKNDFILVLLISIILCLVLSVCYLTATVVKARKLSVKRQKIFFETGTLAKELIALHILLLFVQSGLVAWTFINVQERL